MSLNVAIVGPGRSSQGTGPFVARSFFELGACITGVVGGSPGSAIRAVKALKTDFGIDTESFSTLDELIRSKPVDIIAICSPISSHRPYLDEAIEAGTHIFCEKPLWWPNGGVQNQSDSERIKSESRNLIQRCKDRGLYLHLNTQWPFTLPAYFTLCSMRKPSAESIKSFAMWLSPSVKGESMIVDSVPHLLSMVYSLVGTGRILNIETKSETGSSAKEIDISFDYLHTKGKTNVSLFLRSTNVVPRPAAFAVNRVRVDRHVEIENYVISFRSSGNRLQVADPLVKSIEYFINRINSDSPFDELALVDGMDHLVQIYRALNH